MSDAAYDYDDDTPISELPPEERLRCFKDWLKLSDDAFAMQRAREAEDLEFQDPEKQWPPEAYEERKGRPMIGISLTQQPLQTTYNQINEAKFGVDLKPVNETSLTEVAEAKKGLYSRSQRDGGANTSRMWSVQRSNQCGMGWYRITTQWDEDSDNPSDQEIVYKRILYQEMVKPDPMAEEPDFSDARFLGLGAYISCRDFRKRWPKAVINTSRSFAELATTEPDWVRVNGTQHDPLVVELFYKESTYEEVTIDAEDGPYTRMRERVQVRQVFMTAVEILSDELWLKDRHGRGRKYIPFVPTIGQELTPVNGKRVWVGMVRPSRGAQFTFNYANSQAIEDVSSASKAKYLVVEGQIEGYEEFWDNAHRKPFAYLPYRPVNAAGEPAPPPTLVQVDGTKMQLSLVLSQNAREWAQTALLGYEPLEQPRKKAEQSGRAIIALQNQTDAGRSHYAQNVKDISLPLDARIWLDMAPVVYDRPGRVMHILSGEDETKPIMLNRPYTVQDGRAMQVPEGTEGAEFIDLEKGKYSIVPVMGKSPQTRLEQGQDFMAEVVKAAPELMQFMGDLLFRFRDEPGAKEIADRLQRQIRTTMPYLLDEGKASLEDAKAKVQALEQNVQMLTQQLQQAAQIIQNEQVKQQANIAIAQLKTEVEKAKIASDLQIAEMNNAAKLAVERVKIGGQIITKQSEMAEEREATGLQIAADFAAAEADRDHQRQMQGEKQAHDVGMAAGGANKFQMSREGGQERGQEQSQEQSQGASKESSREQSTQPQADGSGD